jgi:uncharacterized membrane protein YgcG
LLRGLSEPNDAPNSIDLPPTAFIAEKPFPSKPNPRNDVGDLVATIEKEERDELRRLANALQEERSIVTIASAP